MIKAQPAEALKEYAVVDVRGDDFKVEYRSCMRMWPGTKGWHREGTSSPRSMCPARRSVTAWRD